MPMTDSEIARKARQERAAVMQPNTTQPTPVVAVAARHGFTVEEFSPTTETRDVSGAVDRDKKLILVNATENPERKRFTIAHEIGHVVLHSGEGSFVDYRGKMDYPPGDQPKEREANEFARELLMPQNVFEALWNAYGGNVGRVAEQLQVSKRAAEVRASELQLA